ncbi:MAG TPA: DUF177 domain-containing protein [Kofleriaceae bacterium]|nr:DUF177 domain-containing protein [Kofleriaceae bacterium]
MPCHRRFELGPQFIAKAVSGLPMRQVLERPEDDPHAGEGVAEVDLYVEGENVFARGQLTGSVDVACSRCIGPVHMAIDEPLLVTFMPASRVPDAQSAPDAGEVAPAEIESEADADDLDVYPYNGEEIDLEPLLREQVILAVPFAPLCSENCLGLCPVCGIDRNTGTCTCEATPPDPRWSALKNLKP